MKPRSERDENDSVFFGDPWFLDHPLDVVGQLSGRKTEVHNFRDNQADQFYYWYIEQQKIKETLILKEELFPFCCNAMNEWHFLFFLSDWQNLFLLWQQFLMRKSSASKHHFCLLLQYNKRVSQFIFYWLLFKNWYC